MTVRAQKFTPEVLLSAPRRSAGVPNADGSSVLYTTSTYSFETHAKTVELRSLDTKTQESRLLLQDNSISEPLWLPGEKEVYACLKSEDKGKTSILISMIMAGSSWKESTYTAGSIDAPASSLKITQLSEDSYAVVLAAQSSPDGSLYNSETAPKTHSTGKLYKSLFVRHWDDYVTPQKNSLWYATLTKAKDGKFELSKWVNALKGAGLESPVPPFGGTDSFDVSKSGIIFVSKDPKANPALSTKCNVYYIELSSFTEDPAPKPFEYTTKGFKGASASPVFLPDAKKAVFLSLSGAGYESDKSQIFLVEDLKKDSVKRLFNQKTEGSLDKSPQNLVFSHDGKTLYFSAEDQGYGRLFALTSDPTNGEVLRALTDTGYVSDIHPLSNGDVFYTSSSLVDYSSYSIIGTSKSESQAAKWTHSSSKDGSSLGLKASQVSSIHTPASDTTVNKTVHSWVYKPSNFEEGKKYPLALLIHGGPQGAWGDSWSTRWNPAVYAEQGYVVITPNITGSTGYGQAFTDAIRKDWGGAPYNDLVNVMDWVEKNMPEVDMTRAVALGASYGGYMVNWLQGHDLGRRFKALVCHDGIFSFAGGLLATEELYFPFHDLGGTPWYSPSANQTTDDAKQVFGQTSLDAWNKNDPSRYLDHWQTPQLVIHNEKDYRLCISEGLAAFNVLQARGIDSQFLTFPDENHWVLAPENSLVWHKVVLNWINKYVGLPAYCEDDEESADFFGGLKQDGGKTVEMPGMGKPET
ncbi:alpha/beta-hydrolase [Aureobasidium pullulans]|uniref:Dipeptidyl-peptidase V n=1 Tax=Aureobasidium pullulans TaxID=5580 RepID=A0A4S9AZC3_AURPU|nr:alpha/beta-hydrolase [Aureobasidium pullulans]